ncbi:hypothetical protein IEQ44_11165 [Nocardioides sp. Y6]|uniref:DUF2238 domain-containing protein n=1 Tax=Nocardioides malaquae TaxID=2773426 RepID=A0ABR9RUI6_9ACTN|nr:hypothetical protein [Nocardioides malaquae]MBE7325214.1 hypothetical protein [Nocardioides malaquae]
MPLIAPDALRLLAAGSVVAASVTDGWVGFALMLLVLGGCMVPRGWGFPAWFDALFCAALVGAGWAALLDYYERIDWLDLVVHAFVTGLIGAAVAVLVDRVGVLDPSAARRRAATTLGVVATTSAIALAALWEIGEWLGHTFVDDRVQVGYTDTVSDLLAGCVGAVLAAGVVAVSLHRGDV